MGYWTETDYLKPLKEGNSACEAELEFIVYENCRQNPKKAKANLGGVLRTWSKHSSDLPLNVSRFKGMEKEWIPTIAKHLKAMKWNNELIFSALKLLRYKGFSIESGLYDLIPTPKAAEAKNIHAFDVINLNTNPQLEISYSGGAVNGTILVKEKGEVIAAGELSLRSYDVKNKNVLDVLREKGGRFLAAYLEN